MLLMRSNKGSEPHYWSDRMNIRTLSHRNSRQVCRCSTFINLTEEGEGKIGNLELSKMSAIA
jgi:hypothetical protein